MNVVAKTHEVVNQPFALADYNLFTGDAALQEGVAREGAGWACADLDAFGARAGRRNISNSARSPIAIRPSSTPTTAMAAASISCASIPPITS